MNMKKVSIIIPCYNEESSLPLLFVQLDKLTKACPAYDWEFVMVNDGSKDNTLPLLEAERAKDERYQVLDMSRNYGKEVVMLAGLDYAKGDCVVIMDADLQHPPLVIKDMLVKWEEGYDDVYAARRSRGKESWLRKHLTKLYYKMLNHSTRVDVLPNVGDFRLLDRQCVEALKQLREQGRYTKGMFCYIGFRKTGVAFDTQDRAAGESSMTFGRLFALAVEGLMSYTIAPLRIATWIGGVVSVASFIYAIVILIKTLIWGDPVAGYPTLILVILFLGGVQLLSLGIIGEYLGRVYNETKHRPVYFARTFNGQKQ